MHASSHMTILHEDPGQKPIRQNTVSVLLINQPLTETISMTNMLPINNLLKPQVNDKVIPRFNKTEFSVSK